MASFKLHELRCFDAVVRLGSFQAAASALGRTHPSVFAAVGNLEAHLGLTLLDRRGYRVALTEVGRLVHARAAQSLRDLDDLEAHARQLREGDEAVVRVTLGDLCPRSDVLPILSAFFKGRGRTQLNLDHEAVGGPAQRLRNGETDLVFHRADASDSALEQIPWRVIHLVPVVAPGFLPFESSANLTPDHMRPFTQCVIRDTARDGPAEEHFLVEGSPRCSVADHATKKDLILQRMAWGHLPDFMIAEEVRDGRLISLQGRHWPGRVEALVATRRRDRRHGPVAQALWQHIEAAFGSKTLAMLSLSS